MKHALLGDDPDLPPEEALFGRHTGTCTGVVDILKLIRQEATRGDAALCYSIDVAACYYYYDSLLF